MATASKIVWEFTNQTKLNKKEFLNYIEKKVFKTIRQYSMLPESRKVSLKKSEDLNTAVLKYIVEKKFPVSFSSKPNFSSKNLSDISEEIFKSVLQGKLENKELTKKENSPLCDLTDKEVELYASLVGIKGKKEKRDERIQKLFKRFMEKNPDLEHNIFNAWKQLAH